MKLAAALIERGDLQQQLAALKVRLRDNAKYQEGTQVNEDPTQLLAELALVTKRLTFLIAAINHTNSVVRVNGKTLTELLAEREVSKLEVRTLKEFRDQAARTVDQYSRSEIRVLPAVDVAALTAQVNAKAKALRELEVVIQEANWSYELIEDLAASNLFAQG